MPVTYFSRWMKSPNESGKVTQVSDTGATAPLIFCNNNCKTYLPDIDTFLMNPSWWYVIQHNTAGLIVFYTYGREGENIAQYYTSTSVISYNWYVFNLNKDKNA